MIERLKSSHFTNEMNESPNHVVTDLGDVAGQSMAQLSVLTPEPETTPHSQILHILPLGPDLVTRDGRSFILSNPELVIDNSELPLLVDIDHTADLSTDTKASGWIEELYSDPAKGIYGKAELTERGESLIRSKEYRYTSAVVSYDPQTGEISKILRLSLTNTPAMPVEQIAAFSQSFLRVSPANNEETPSMDELHVQALFAEVGLSAQDVPEAKQAIATFADQIATLSAQVEVLTERAEKAEATIREQDEARFSTEVEHYLDEASKAGKMLPAERESLQALALVSEAQFATVKALVDARPIHLDPAPLSTPSETFSLAGLDAEVVERLRAKGWDDSRIQSAHLSTTKKGHSPENQEG